MMAKIWTHGKGHSRQKQQQKPRCGDRTAKDVCGKLGRMSEGAVQDRFEEQQDPPCVP